jgi:hypothetical protein
MTTNALHHRTGPVHQAASTVPLATAALVGALSSAAFSAGFALLADQSPRESTLSPYTLTVNVLTTLAFAGLAFTIPSLSRVLDAPRWVINTCAAACAAVAAMSWSLVTIAAHVASQVSDDEFTEFTTYLEIFPAPKMLLGLVGFTALGIHGWRRRSVPRGACVLLVLAGVLSLWWAYPPATVFAGLAFLWIAKSVDDGARD